MRKKPSYVGAYLTRVERKTDMVGTSPDIRIPDSPSNSEFSLMLRVTLNKQG